MRKLLTISFIACTIHCAAQSTNVTTLFINDFKKGEQFYKILAYRNALELYLHYEDRHPGNRTVNERIADCYLRLGNFEQAELWFEKLANDPLATADEYYQYGQVLSMLRKYPRAAAAYRSFSRLAPGDSRGRSKLSFLENMAYHHRDSNLYTVRSLWFNSDQSDFGARFFHNGIVFVSARDRDLFIKRKSLSALNDDETPLNTFFASNQFDDSKGVDDQVELFYKRDLNSIYHDGPVTFFQNGKKIAFSRNTTRGGHTVKDSKGKVNLELIFASLNSDYTMSHTESFSHNSHEFSTGHPWLSEDGSVLYFSSDAPGGLGGADIYVSTLNDGKWSEPKNLGAPVNTAGDEFYPHLFRDSVLFFASNGHGSFGGLDNFVSRKKGENFETPVNMGSPVNSELDDFAVIVDSTGTSGYFSSNRKGGKGYDDIYSFTLNRFTLLGMVVERSTRQPIADAKVLIRTPEGLLIDSVLTDSTGRFYMQLPLNKDFRVHSQKNGYTSIEDVLFHTRANSLLTDTLTIPIWEHGLFAQGKIYSNELQSILPGSTVILDNITDATSDTATVHSDGFYNFLVLPDKQYKITARKDSYIANGFLLNTQGLYRGKLVNDILLEEKFLERLDVLFDLNESLIKPEFVKSLDRFIKDLKRAPKSTVNIGAHADARGTFEYNMDLSTRRAQAIVEYFVSAGIVRSRIEARGFGEELILNRCSDGVECTDEEHSRNRRAEIKIQLE